MGWETRRAETDQTTKTNKHYTVRRLAHNPIEADNTEIHSSNRQVLTLVRKQNHHNETQPKKCILKKNVHTVINNVIDVVLCLF